VDALTTGLGDCRLPVNVPSACEKAFKNTNGLYECEYPNHPAYLQKLSS